MKSTIEVHAERHEYGRVIALYIIDYPRSPDGLPNDQLFAASLNWVDQGENHIKEPSLQLSETQAQHLIDQLWACGLRPVEAAGSAGSLAATQAHLQDKRRLVFKEERP